MEEVARSIRVSSTFVEGVHAVGFTLGGLIAGEGSFCVSRTGTQPFPDGSSRCKFALQVKMASRDRPLLVALRAFLGVGSIADSAPRHRNWQPESAYTVNSIRAARNVVIPFADRYLLPSAKRDQFESWRATLAAYIEAHPKVIRERSICSVDGCGHFVRGRGLCRIHYYRLTGY